MSLYADYILEREGKQCIERKHGFITYLASGDDCYIIDFYVTPEARRTGKGTELANLVSQSAKKIGCKRLLGSVVPSTNGCSESMQALLWYGFKLLSARENFILLYKEIL